MVMVLLLVVRLMVVSVCGIVEIGFIVVCICSGCLLVILFFSFLVWLVEWMMLLGLGYILLWVWLLWWCVVWNLLLIFMFLIVWMFMMVVVSWLLS